MPPDFYIDRHLLYQKGLDCLDEIVSTKKYKNRNIVKKEFIIFSSTVEVSSFSQERARIIYSYFYFHKGE